MKRILSVAMAAAFAGAMPAVQAQSIPTMEACAKYAEADYAEDGGMQSDVWDVMVKLLTHQRNRCTQLYGL